MGKKKRIVWNGFLMFIILGLTGCFLSKIPSPQADRIDGENFVGVDAGGSFAWVIPTKTGVVLVDAGWDEEGEALKKEIAGRKVHAILITHAHFDHLGGLPLFPDAIVYIGPGEGPLIKGEVEPGGWMARMSTSMMAPDPYTPPILKELTDGQTLEIDGESFTTIHVYGHTQGSAMYIWQDVLFTGDTIVGRGDYVDQIPAPTYDDYDAVRGNVAKVLNYSFDRIADGHVGLHKDAKKQVEAYVGLRKDAVAHVER